MRSEVQILPDPPRFTEIDEGDATTRRSTGFGAIAQLGERLPCTQEVGSSILPGSTNSIRLENVEGSGCIELVSVERRISIAL